jgi:hypothetical protein
MLKVYVVSYILPCGKKVYWHESLTCSEAIRLGKSLAISGHRPRVIRVYVSPSSLMGSADRVERNLMGCWRL